MENKNVTTNLLIKQMIQSDSMGYDLRYIATPIDIEFKILEKAYKNTGREYAKLKMSIQQGECLDTDCTFEYRRIQQLENSPKLTLDFLGNITSELAATEEPYFDPNNNFAYTVANCMVTTKPGFSVTDGYSIDLQLLQNGTQQITFKGPAFEYPLSINSAALSTLLDSGTSLVADTPDINQDMNNLLIETGIFSPDDIGENKKLSAGAKISEEFILKFNGEPDYEIIDIGEGKGRNVLRYDLDKIEKKALPFINAEIAGILSAEQEAIAAWNVFLAKETSYEEDDQMAENANAGYMSWDYSIDLPLMQDQKELFSERYKEYFFKNYLTQFITNKLPSVEEDAAVFDLAEGRSAKAEKFMGDNQ